MFSFSSDKDPRVEFLDHMEVLFLILWRNLHTFFHSTCTNLNSYQQCARAPCIPHPRQCLLFVVFLVVAVLTGVRRFTVVFVCIYQMIIDAERLFTCLPPCMSSLERMSVQLCCPFLQSGCFLTLSCMSPLYTWGINPDQMCLLQTSFPIQ